MTSNADLGLDWNDVETEGYVSRFTSEDDGTVTDCPPLLELLESQQERDKLIAFASTLYIHQDVLFWSEVEQFRHTSDGKGRLAHGKHIVIQYVDPLAPHPVHISEETQDKLLKQWARKAGGVVLAKNFFEVAKKEVEEFINVRLYPQYAGFWRDEQKLAGARNRLALSVTFDLDNPPPLEELLRIEATREQLTDFAVSVYSEENVLFWEAVSCRYVPETRTEERAVILKDVFDTFVAKGCRMGINVAGGLRSSLLAAYDTLCAANPDGMPRGGTDDFFDGCIRELLSIMSMEIYPKFLRHVRAARREMALNKELAEETNSSEEELTLTEVLHDPIQYESLLIFAARLYSQERIVFWKLAEDFRTTNDSRKRRELATAIIEEYIEDNSLHQVTLDGSRKRALLEKWEALHVDTSAQVPSKLFASAQKEVERNMQHELFSLYLESQEEKKKAAAAAEPNKPQKGLAANVKKLVRRASSGRKSPRSPRSPRTSSAEKEGDADSPRGPKKSPRFRRLSPRFGGKK